jgi:hypothetical protein
MELGVFILGVGTMFLVRAGNTEISEALGVYHPSKIPTKIYKLMTLPALRMTI